MRGSYSSSSVSLSGVDLLADTTGAREVTQEEYYSTLLLGGGRGNGTGQQQHHDNSGGGGGGGSSSKSCAPDLFFHSTTRRKAKGGGNKPSGFSRRVLGLGGGGGGGGQRSGRTWNSKPRKNHHTRGGNPTDNDDEAFSVVSDCGPTTTLAAQGDNYYDWRRPSSSSSSSVAAAALPASVVSSAASVCNATVASHDTVKASNTSDVPTTNGGDHKSGRGSSPNGHPPNKAFRNWGKLRGFLGVVGGGTTTTAGGGEGTGPGRLHSVSEEHPRSSNLVGGGGGVGQRRPRSHSDDRTAGAGGGKGSRRGGGKRRGGGDRAGSAGVDSSDAPPTSRAEQAKLDQSILGRYDGLVVLSLGPANLTTLDAAATEEGAAASDSGVDGDRPHCRPETLLPWERFPPHTFTGRSAYLSPAEVVSRALWTDAPTIVLEGFVPGEDRWGVRIEQVVPSTSSTSSTSSSNASASLPRRGPPTASVPISRHRSPYRLVPSSGEGSHDGASGPPSITPVLTEEDAHSDSHTNNDDDGGSPIVPSYHLWPTLWGNSDPAPDRADLNRLTEEDPLLHLAAEHSIPIDLDENTFCVSDRAQWDSVQAFLGVALGVGRFDAAILILTKLLGGMDLLPPNDPLRFLRGAVLHNLGLVRMWQGLPELALEHFHAAVQERSKALPRGHPDAAVSTAWKGLAQLALGRYDDALYALELALDGLPGGTDPSPNPGTGTCRHDLARAKLLGCVGVVHYQMRKSLPALRHFTAALEVQRGWLEGAARRDAVVCDAATMLGNMGKLYLEIGGDGDRAYFVYEEALLLRTAVVRRDHELVWESLLGLALTRARDGQARSALHILQGCLRSQTARFGRDAPESIDTLGYLGYLYEHLECHEDALKCLATVKKWQKLHLPPNHPSLRKTKETVHRLEESIGTKVSVWV